MPLSLLRLREMTPDDWTDVALIYAEGMATGQATFTIEVPSWGTQCCSNAEVSWSGDKLR